MNSTSPNAEAEKLFQELQKCFLVIEKLKDPIQIAVRRKELSILHSKWKNAVHVEIEDEFVPQILPLFGSHAYQVILFDICSAINVSLSILLTDYSVADYNQIMGQLYRLIEDYSDAHTYSVSTITVSYPLSPEHPLYEQITTGIIIWQKGGDDT